MLSRPEIRLGLVGVALVAGEALGLSLNGSAVLWPVVMSLALFALSVGFGYRLKFWPVAFVMLLGLALAMRENALQHEVLSEVRLRNGYLSDSFVVKGEARIGASDTNGLRWVSFPSAFANEKISILFRQCATNDIPHIGETWTCAGWLNDSTHDRPRQLWVTGRGTFARYECAAHPYAMTPWLNKVRRSLSRRLGIGLDDRPMAADLNRAMLLGERAAIPWETRQDFVRSGTMHVFAISGLHVMIVAQAMLYLLIVILFPIRLAGLVLIPFLWIYVLMIGSPASAVRAAAMTSVYYAAPLFYRRPDSLVAWEVTLIAFALLDPIGLFGIGSMLSFVVVLGILLFVRWAKPFKSRLLTTVGLPFVAWVAGVPISARVFSHITPGGLVANLVEIPLATCAVVTSVLGIASSFISDAIAAHVNNLAALFTDAMSGVSWAVSRIPGADFEIMPWSLTLCVAWYVGIIAAFLWMRAVHSRRRSSLA